MSPTEIAFWLTYVGGLAAAIFNPVAGVLLYVLVYHLNPETQWWGSLVRTLGLRTSFTVVLATGVGLLIRQPHLQYGARQFPLPITLAILFGLIALGSLTWGVDVTTRAEYLAEKLIKLLIILLILIRCVRTPRHYHLLYLAWLAGVAYIGYQSSGGVGLVMFGRLTGGVGGPDFADSSGLAVHLVASLPLVGAAFFMARTWWGRGLALLIGALTVNAIIATRTRNVVVGLAAMAFVGVFSLPRGYRLKGLAAAVVGTLLAVQLVDPGWWERMSSLANYQQDASAMSRLDYWGAALAMVNDYPFGIGLGNFHYQVAEYIPGLGVYHSAHSTVMACLAELGWLGLFVFLGIIGVSYLRLRRVQRLVRELPDRAEIRLFHWRTHFHLGWHAMALRTALVGYFACALFTTRLFSEDLWLLIGFSACLHNVSKYMVAQNELDSTAVPETSPAQEAPAPALAVPAGKVQHVGPSD